MAEGEAQQGKRTCPVCDEPVSAEAMVCPSCSTDLSLFSAEEMDIVPDDAETLKSQLMADGNGHLSDLLKAADGTTPQQQTVPEAPGAVEYEAFECPECGGEVPGDAAACPHCGVEFEMEEVFECPMCGSMIDVNVDKCPSCGAEFEAAEDEPADISSQIVEETAPQPEEKPPEPEKPQEPVSFADRLKQVKEQPSDEPAPKPEPEPKKELSFAERMKAMKEGGLDEVEKPADPAPKPGPEPAKETPEPEKPTPSPDKPQPGGDQSFSDRMKAIKQATQDQPSPSPGPGGEPKVTKPAPDPEASKKENYKELPRHIAEVKKLLLLANKMKIDISASKALINKAVTAGKQRDLANAIRLVKEGKSGLERDLRSAMVSRMRTFQNAIALEKKSGKDVAQLEASIDSIKKLMDAGDFHTAHDELNAMESRMAQAAGATLSRAELDMIGKTLADAKVLRVNVEEANSYYTEAKNAMELDDKETASEMTRKATESLSKVLPGYIAGEMRKAKVTLREIKMMNVDISKPVEILKEANDSVRDGDYLEALSSIKEFKDFVSNAKK